MGGSSGDSSGGGSGPECDSGAVNTAGDGCDAACTVGAVNAAGDGCEEAGATFSPPGTFIVPATCSTGVVNVAGDGCDPACDSGVVNAAGDGCDAACTFGAVNAAGDGCEEAGATFSPPGTFADAGSFTPGNGKGGGDGDGAVIGAIVGSLAGCLLIVALVYLVQQRRQQTKKATLSDLPKGWSSFIDPSTGYPCYVFDKTGDTQWDHPNPKHGEVEMAAMENPLRQKMKDQKKKKKGGGKHHARASTQLPAGWDKDFDDEVRIVISFMSLAIP